MTLREAVHGRALPESEARLRLALDVGRLGTCELDIRTQTFTASDVFRAIFGRDPTDPFTFADLLACLDGGARKIVRKTVEEGSGDFVLECRVSGVDQSPRRIRLRGLVLDDGGRPRLIAACADVTEQHQFEALKRRAQKSNLVAGELQHRLLNLFPVIFSIVRMTQTFFPQAADYAQALESRLRALAVAETLLSRHRSADIVELTRLALRPFSEQGQFQIRGPKLRLPGAIAQSLALIVHELTTNSVKHGALGTPAGRAAVSWQVVAARRSGSRLIFEWIEEGGPPVRPPLHKGFGTQVLTESGFVLGGATIIDYAPEGLRYRLEMPLGRHRLVKGIKPRGRA